ncbi:hypothetical protein Ahy_A03g016930 isoform B [Arachis hypogaea]|uniref:Uncharacterized protein n=1 Tax=Arachis hypogaea TaxID=3818 RepID=A0A445E4Q1_ARAHY|nr:hypothetical protein Ahy_A03g016930 isoform B [Arachis hypogaea]
MILLGERNWGGKYLANWIYAQGLGENEASRQLDIVTDIFFLFVNNIPSQASQLLGLPFELLYLLCMLTVIADLEDERNHLLHHTVDCYLDAVRWNPLNQKEVACASEERGEVLLFDLEGSDILSMKFKPASETIMGPFEVDFTSDSRVLASNSAGSVCVWDIRSGKQASKLQSTNPTGDALYGMAIAADKQTVVAGGSLGKLYAWDIRGGNASLDTIHNRDLRKIVGNSSEKVIQPFSVVENLNLTLPGLYPNIDNCVNSLNFNPVRPSHVAYNLSCDWVGIYDVRIDSITHKFKQNQESCGYRRKCSWLPLGSICLVGSEIERVQGVRFLDFHPNQRSLIYSENFVRDERTKFLPVEKFVNSCAAHPIYDAVVSGTEENSLLVLSQPRESFLPEDPYP